MSNTFRNIVLASLFLTFVVVVLGAYVRLSDAGLGCPDWPGCYGHIIGVPDTDTELAHANTNFDRAVEAPKAWKEMIHRYFAGTLGILIFVISIFLVRKDKHGERHVFAGVVLSSALLFQAMLGMWTVTLQLKPLIVMGHLLGGFTLFNLIAWQFLRTTSWQPQINLNIAKSLFNMSIVVVFVLIGQIALGGWVSSNYAALACVDFPQCQQSWWPAMNFKDAFVLWRGLGVDYEFGVLDHPARVAIHYAHRMGAVVATLAIVFYATRLWKHTDTRQLLKTNAMVISGLLAFQICLGISNVIFKLPLAVAVLHNGVALLLLFSLVTSIYMLKSARINH
jgi:cytochrome c oxidase assembly protein subunit 15